MTACENDFLNAFNLLCEFSKSIQKLANASTKTRFFFLLKIQASKSRYSISEQPTFEIPDLLFNFGYEEVGLVFFFKYKVQLNNH